MDSFVWVTFEKEGLHKYPAAADDPKLATGDEYDVSFLQYVHRHIFKFRVDIEVFQSLYEGEFSVDYKSCEMISDELADKIQDRYPGRRLAIEVSEDGENGSRILYHVDN